MTDEEIIKLIRSGGKPMEAAVKSLHTRVAQAMLRFFVYRGASTQDAEDILQETFVKICTSAHTYRGEAPAAAWIWKLAHNCLADFYRGSAARFRYEEAVNDDVWDGVSQTIAANATADRSADECITLGLATFGRLEPERVYVLTLQMDGHDIGTISHRIGRSAAATKVYLYESRKKLAPFIEHCLPLLAS